MAITKIFRRVPADPRTDLVNKLFYQVHTIKYDEPLDHKNYVGVVIMDTSKEPVCPRVELILKIIIIIFLGFIKSKPC